MWFDHSIEDRIQPCCQQLYLHLPGPKYCHSGTNILHLILAEIFRKSMWREGHRNQRCQSWFKKKWGQNAWNNVYSRYVDIIKHSLIMKRLRWICYRVIKHHRLRTFLTFSSTQKLTIQMTAFLIFGEKLKDLRKISIWDVFWN